MRYLYGMPESQAQRKQAFMQKLASFMQNNYGQAPVAVHPLLAYRLGLTKTAAPGLWGRIGNKIVNGAKQVAGGIGQGAQLAGAQAAGAIANGVDAATSAVLDPAQRAGDAVVQAGKNAVQAGRDFASGLKGQRTGAAQSIGGPGLAQAAPNGNANGLGLGLRRAWQRGQQMVNRGVGAVANGVAAAGDAAHRAGQQIQMGYNKAVAGGARAADAALTRAMQLGAGTKAVLQPSIDRFREGAASVK